MEREDLEDIIVQRLNTNTSIPNSRDLAQELKVDHEAVVGAIKSLEAIEFVTSTVESGKKWELTPEGEDLLVDGASPEILVLQIIFDKKKLSKAELSQLIAAKSKKPEDVEKIGYGQAMKEKWVTQQKDPQDAKNILIQCNVAEVPVDNVYQSIASIKKGANLDEKVLDGLKKRKLVTQNVYKYFSLAKGPKYMTEIKRKTAELTFELMQSGDWKNLEFKDYNFQAKGRKPAGGHLHPLQKVRSEFRKIFLELGFEEMKTNNFVESSFWNFDALFQPQQHPARDAHDTFFLTKPSNCKDIPEDYLARVKEVHERGGFGSIGYQYEWKREEASKNILRTHTTAVSSRYLYALAEEIKQNGGKFTPKKYFSIDRVFRNEVLDATHLCEFHQIEGMVIDRGLNLGDLIGLFTQFFQKIGITQLKYKPAYNPYTEPSMEIFGYHPKLDRWVEVGNSGMFRPEMLRPLGIPEDVTVLAWGLGLERQTMIMYNYSSVHDLVGHRVPVSNIYENPLCRLDKKRAEKIVSETK